MVKLKNIAKSSNGRTAAFGVAYSGSNPGLAALLYQNISNISASGIMGSMKHFQKQTFFILAGIGLFLLSLGWIALQSQPGNKARISSNTIVPSPTPIPTPLPIGAIYPAQILDLTNWKLTIPIGSFESPTEIKQPALSTYILDPWFVVASSGDAVRFRAPVSSVTTSGSDYPRSELREMIDSGQTKASWSSARGVHTMFLDEAITAVPQKKQHVVAGQIHDDHDDIIVIRLEYPKLYVNVDGKNRYVLDANYTLGKRFTVRFVVQSGQTSIYYNDSASPVYTLTQDYENAYFKAGIYTQSNCRKEKDGSCGSDNYGEAVIYQAVVSHE